jgi:hypothetical protein
MVGAGFALAVVILVTIVGIVNAASRRQIAAVATQTASAPLTASALQTVAASQTVAAAKTAVASQTAAADQKTAEAAQFAAAAQTAAAAQAIAAAQTAAVTQTAVAAQTAAAAQSAAATQTAVATQAKAQETATPAPGPTNTATATAIPVPTSTATMPPTATPRPPTATPTPPAPTLLAPPNGASFLGYNDRVDLVWSAVPGLRDDEFYVVSIPYNDAGMVAEFWRKTTTMRVPSHFSTVKVGFSDRHYNWYVQVKRCTGNCFQALDDNAKKTGVAVGARSAEGLFYWHADVSSVPATPTKVPLK